jgi:hypothetical protein
MNVTPHPVTLNSKTIISTLNGPLIYVCISDGGRMGEN